MKIYVDSESRCHAADDGSMRSVEDSFFDGKCAAFIEGYKLEESDGLRHIYPVVDSRILDAYQKQYEAMLPELEAAKAELADADEALNIMEVYANDTD